MIRRFIFVMHVYWINIFGKSNRISFTLLNKSEHNEDLLLLSIGQQYSM